MFERHDTVAPRVEVHPTDLMEQLHAEVLFIELAGGDAQEFIRKVSRTDIEQRSVYANEREASTELIAAICKRRGWSVLEFDITDGDEYDFSLGKIESLRRVDENGMGHYTPPTSEVFIHLYKRVTIEDNRLIFAFVDVSESDPEGRPHTPTNPEIRALFETAYVYTIREEAWSHVLEERRQKEQGKNEELLAIQELKHFVRMHEESHGKGIGVSMQECQTIPALRHVWNFWPNEAHSVTIQIRDKGETDRLKYDRIDCVYISGPQAVGDRYVVDAIEFAVE